MKKKPIEGVFFAQPRQLNIIADFRSDGTLFMSFRNGGIWFEWQIVQGRIIACRTSGKYKGEEVVFIVKGDELFLNDIRFQKQE